MAQVRNLYNEQTRAFGLPPHTLWEALSNTEHFNRAMKLPAVQAEPVKVREGEIFTVAKATYGPLTLAIWKEYPFSWVTDRKFEVIREYQKGPFRRLRYGAQLDPADKGTKVTLYLDIRPRNFFWSLLLPWLAKGFLAHAMKYVIEYSKRLESYEQLVLPRPARPDPPGKMLRMVRGFLSRNQCSEPLSYRFQKHLLEASEDELVQMRPYQLAAQWKTDRKETLSLFLRATEQGLLNLDWVLVCPNCRVSKASFSQLGEVAPTYHCDLCNIDFHTDFENFTELRFSPSSDLFDSQFATFCLGSPARSPHIYLQQCLPAGQSLQTELSLPDGPLRVRVLRENTVLAVEQGINKKPTVLELTLTDAGWKSKGKFQPGVNHLSLRNDSSNAVVVVLESMQLDAFSVSAAEVTTLQEFRSLFGGQVLGAGYEVGVRYLCFLFSDLKDSTVMYEELGNAESFFRVQKHFEYMELHISNEGGSIVKTMGDAVMAVFYSPDSALRAATAIQRGIEGFNESNGFEPPITVKIGLHAGPALLMNHDNKLDYFGQTVNKAARIQGLSTGDDIVLSEKVVSRLQTEVRARPFRVSLKGIGGSVRVFRLKPTQFKADRSRPRRRPASSKKAA